MAISDVVPVRSDRCGLDELFLSCEPGGAERGRLALGPGWTRQWTATWRIRGADEVSLVRDLGPGLPPGTKDYVARRTAEGKTKTEIMRCLKRYIAREVFPRLLATASPSAHRGREGATQPKAS